VFDVGASEGQWTEAIGRVFPDAEFHMFEPLASASAQYAQRAPRADQQHVLHEIAATDANGPVTIHISEDQYSSSVHGHPTASRAVTTPGWRLADYCQEKRIPTPDLLKVDVQGSADAVLRGCEPFLDQVGVVHLETWLRRGYGPGTPLLTELIDWLRPRGFVLIELGNQYLTSWNEILHIDGFFMNKRLIESLRANVPEPKRVEWFAQRVQAA
jgi:FkbM family methyltransferase